MKAIQLLTIISLLLLVIACVPPAEELANITKENKTETAKPTTEVKQEITIMPPVDNKTENLTIQSSERKENTTTATQNANSTPPITTAATQPPRISGDTIIYTGGAIEMGEGESAKIIMK